MNRRAMLLSTLGLALRPAVADARPPFRLYPGPQPLLPLVFQDAKGGDLTLADFAGRVVLLNVWATWCPPCRKEMPDLDALQAQLGGSDFIVVPVSIDQDGLDKPRQFYREIGIRNLGLYWGEDLRVQLALAVFGLPTTLLINRSGQEIGRVSGPFKWDSAASVAQITRVIEGT